MLEIANPVSNPWVASAYGATRVVVDDSTSMTVTGEVGSESNRGIGRRPSPPRASNASPSGPTSTVTWMSTSMSGNSDFAVGPESKATMNPGRQPCPVDLGRVGHAVDRRPYMQVSTSVSSTSVSLSFSSAYRHH